MKEENLKNNQNEEQEVNVESTPKEEQQNIQGSEENLTNEETKLEENKNTEEKKEDENIESTNVEEEEEIVEVEEVVEDTNEKENSEKQENDIAKIFKEKRTYISGLVGAVIGVAVVLILSFTGVLNINNKVVAKTSVGKMTEHMVYEEIKDVYKIDNMLETIDKKILEKEYKLSEDQEKEIDGQVKEILELYNSYYGYTEEQFLSANGFADKDAFRNYLSFDYKRNLAFIDYIETIASEEEINKYYDKDVYGAIKTKHILVPITNEVTEKDALKLAKEIIKKLDKKADWEKVAKEYGKKVKFEDLDYKGFGDNLADEYVKESKKLKNGKYTKTPVKTSQGYEIIYREDQKAKPSLDEIKDKILSVIGEKLEGEDQNIRYKALIKLREKYKVEFKDEKYKADYEEYCKNHGA